VLVLSLNRGKAIRVGETLIRLAPGGMDRVQLTFAADPVVKITRMEFCDGQWRPFHECRQKRKDQSNV